MKSVALLYPYVTEAFTATHPVITLSGRAKPAFPQAYYYSFNLRKCVENANLVDDYTRTGHLQYCTGMK